MRSNFQYDIRRKRRGRMKPSLLVYSRICPLFSTSSDRGNQPCFLPPEAPSHPAPGSAPLFHSPFHHRPQGTGSGLQRNHRFAAALSVDKTCDIPHYNSKNHWDRSPTPYKLIGLTCHITLFPFYSYIYIFSNSSADRWYSPALDAPTTYQAQTFPARRPPFSTSIICINYIHCIKRTHRAS